MTEPVRPAAPVGGGAWVVAGVVVPNAYVVVLSVAVDRELGVAALGRQSLIAFVAAAATTLAGAGGFVAVVRAVAAALGEDRTAAARSVARWGLRLHAVTGAAAAAVVAAPVLWGVDPRPAWLLAAVGAGLATLQMVPMAVLVGARRWRDATAVGLVTGAVAVPVTIAVLVAGGGIEGVFAVEVAVFGINLLWTGGLARRALADQAPGPPTDDLVDPGRLRFAALSALGAAVTVVVWRRSELVVLSWLSSDEEVARFSVAFAAWAVLLTLAERFSAVLTSAFSGLAHRHEDARLGAARDRAERLLLVAALPLVALAAALGPPTIGVLYGDEYARSGAVLLVLLATVVALPRWTVSAAVLAAHGDATSPLLVGIGAMALDIALSIPLVAAHGALGAAVASVAGQVAAVAALHLVARRRTAPGPWDVGSIGRALGVAAVAGGVAAAVAAVVPGVAGVAGGILGGGAALVAAAAVARPLTGADAAWLGGSLGGSPGPSVAAGLGRIARPAEVDGYEAPADATSS